MKALAPQDSVTKAVTGVTGFDAAAPLGDFHANDEGVHPRVVAQRERIAAEQADKAKHLVRPARTDATANVTDSHVDRVVPDGASLRFGYGIERMVLKGTLPPSCLRACERLRLDWEAAHRGGAYAVIDPTRVRVDSSPNIDPFFASVDKPQALMAALKALGGEGSPLSIVLVRCAAEGKTLKVAAGELASKGLGSDPEFARGLLVAGAILLVRHYGY